MSLEREYEGALPPVVAPRYPGRKEEAWWLVVGDPKANTLLGIKRITLGAASKVKLDFSAPSTPGAHNLMLYFMCDSYLGCDQEYEFKLEVSEAAEGSDEEDGMEQD